jgi:FkbM family methyltransferase
VVKRSKDRALDQDPDTGPESVDQDPGVKAAADLAAEKKAGKELSAEKASRRARLDEQGRKHLDIVERLNSMSETKQLNVMEEWGGVEVELDHGLSITALTKKELRRFTRPREPSMMNWLRSFEPGEVFYDIGANCGSLTLEAAAMHRGQITVVAIEPGYGSFESLARNLARNDLMSSTIPLQVALLDRTGLEPMNYYRSTNAGTSLHAVGAPVDQYGQEFTPVAAQMMPTYALDDLIEVLELPRPTRVKIDVDGYEEPVLRGSPKTLAAGTIRELAVEVINHDGQGTRLEMVGQLLEPHGYALTERFSHGDTEKQGFVSDYLFRHGS